MIYEEKTKSNKVYISVAIILLAIMFAPVYLGMQELFSDEGFYLAAVREMDQFPPLVKTQGEIGYGCYPFYPYLVRLLYDAGVPMITALRLIPCICLLILAGIIFLIAWKAKNLTAGVVGVSALLINFLTIEKFSTGNPVLLGTLGVFSTWIVWYTVGIWRNKWKLAWILSFLLAGLTFYTIGFTGLLLIIFPMLFHRRPLMIWTKPRGKAFLSGVIILILFILLWGIPRWSQPESPVFERTTFVFPSIGDYFIHLLTFPFDAAIRFMPWMLFAWAPFCPALVSLDENPILSRYLRTLFLGTFAILWQSRDIFFMIPPLAILVALNYWIVVRRYGWRLLKLSEIASAVLFLFCTAAFCYYLIPREYHPGLITDYLHSVEHSPYRIPGIIASGIGIFLSGTAFIMSLCGARIWLTIIILFGAVVIPYRGVVIPYQNLFKHKEYIGRTFRNTIPEKKTPEIVYKMRDIPPYYNEMHYFDIKLKTIGSAEELPAEEPVVYVFSSVVPSAPDRTWQRLHMLSRYNSRLELWRGKLKTEEEYE